MSTLYYSAPNWLGARFAMGQISLKNLEILARANPMEKVMSRRPFLPVVTLLTKKSKIELGYFLDELRLVLVRP